MVNGGKKLGDVALERVHGQFFTQKFLEPAHTDVGALAYPTGIGVEDKAAFKQRFNDCADGVMDDAVDKRRGGDGTKLRVVDEKLPVRTGLPCVGFQRSLYFHQAFIHFGGKPGNGQTITFAAAGQFPCPHQIGKRGNLKKETRRQHNFYCMLMDRGAGSFVCAAIRSGNWDNAANDGPFTLNLNNAPTNVNTNIGFRCASIHSSSQAGMECAPVQNRPATAGRSITISKETRMITDQGYRVPASGRGEISNRMGWGANRFLPRRFLCKATPCKQRQNSPNHYRNHLWSGTKLCGIGHVEGKPAKRVSRQTATGIKDLQ